MGGVGGRARAEKRRHRTRTARLCSRPRWSPWVVGWWLPLRFCYAWNRAGTRWRWSGSLLGPGHVGTGRGGADWQAVRVRTWGVDRACAEEAGRSGCGGASAFCSVILARAHAWNLEAPRRGRQLLLRSVSVCSYGPCTTSHGTDRFVVVQVPSICMCSIHAECAANAAGSKIRLGAGNSTSLRTFSGDPTCN